MGAQRIRCVQLLGVAWFTHRERAPLIAEIASRLSERVVPGWTTRFAPAPTGWLHLGHVVNALFVWGLARALGGRVLLRMEDHDRGRCRPEYEAGLLEDLAWLGFVPDESAAPMWRQSDRDSVYEKAMDTLGGDVYPCICSRRDLEAVAGSLPNVEARYPGTCRARTVDPANTLARRVVMEAGTERFDDVVLGQQRQDPSAQCGDVLIRDRTANWTYQFAVSVDDMEQGIDVVIRGIDLLPSTGRQLRIARMLGRTSPPVFVHHPLLLRSDGTKLSKSDGATGIRELRAAGWTPEDVTGKVLEYLSGTNRE